MALLQPPALQAEEPAWVKAKSLEKPGHALAEDGQLRESPGSPEVLGGQTTEEGDQAWRPCVRDPEPQQPRGAWPGFPSIAQGGNPAGRPADIKPSHRRPGLGPSPGLNEAINPRAGWREGPAPAHVLAAGQRPASLAGGD